MTTKARLEKEIATVREDIKVLQQRLPIKHRNLHSQTALEDCIYTCESSLVRLQAKIDQMSYINPTTGKPHLAE